MTRLLIISAESGGGLAHAARQEAAHATSRGYQVCLVTPDELRAGPSAEILAPAMPTRSSQLGQLWRFCTRVQRAARTFGAPEIIHCHGLRAGIVGGVLCLRAAQLPRRHLHLTVHGHGSPIGTRLWVRLVKRYVMALLPHLCASCTAVSPDAPSGWAFLLWPSPRLHELAIAASPEGGVTDVQPPPILTLLWVGRLDPQKRPMDVLMALSTDTVRHRWRLWVIGDGPLLEPCMELAHQRRLPVTFLGPSGNVAESLAQADAFVLLSNFEGLPFAVMEALVAGLPLLLSPLSNLRWLAGRAARYARALQDVVAVLDALQDAALRADLAAHSRDRGAELLGAPSGPETYLRHIHSAQPRRQSRVQRW